MPINTTFVTWQIFLTHFSLLKLNFKEDWRICECDRIILLLFVSWRLGVSRFFSPPRHKDAKYIQVNNLELQLYSRLLCYLLNYRVKHDRMTCCRQ
jgi:hypothetical protein